MNINSEIQAVILDCVAKALGELPEAFNASTPLMSSGLLDSFAALDLMQAIEVGLSVTFRDEDLTPENFENVEALANLLSTYSTTQK